MPRANRYFLPERTYHLTHRCHDRTFLLRFARDRDTYRQIFWEALQQSSVWLLAYCVTSNHVHLLARAEEADGISSLMQAAQGEFAQHYNRRKRRSGAFWEGRYHSTLIDGGVHLERCMIYIELNMVRAGAVRHPEEWAWDSYREWIGARKRYCLVDVDRSLALVGNPALAEFRRHYKDRIREAILRGELARRPEWTESVAVGGEEFVREVKAGIAHRQRFEVAVPEAGVWCLREQPQIMWGRV